MVGRTQGSLDETLGLDRSAAPPTLPDRLGHAQTPTQRLRSLELGFDQGFRQRVHHLDLQRLVYVEPFLGLGRLQGFGQAALLNRRAEAHRRGWLGETDGIDVTLEHLRRQRERTRRLPTPRTVTQLGMPTLADGAGRGCTGG